MEAGVSTRVAIVTGAGRGLGRAFALGLAGDGCAVVVNDVDDSAVAVVGEIEAAGGTAVACQGSVADSPTVEAVTGIALETFGRLDVLVNNAGIVRQTPIEEMPIEEFDEVIAVHLRGSMMMSRAAFPAMREAGGGRIVTVASSSGAFGLRGQIAYGSAKAGQMGLTRALAIEGDAHDIRANAIFPWAATSPGRTTTDLPGRVWKPLAPRRLPDHVVPLVLYLASRACDRTGRFYSALAGRYAEIFTGLTAGWLSPDEGPPSPTQLESHLDEIESRQTYTVPRTLEDEVTVALDRLQAEQEGE
jgi:NAD(P)-dependent dehydrogenase (short-subunit alcohol dehydrogenase family)